MHLGNLHQQLVSLVRSKLDVSDVVDAGSMLRRVVVTQLRLNGAGAKQSTGYFGAQDPAQPASMIMKKALRGDANTACWL